MNFIWIGGGLRALLKCEGVRLSIKPAASLIKPLKRMDIFSGMFVAVDCSTRTLKRANNWGIYLMRAAYAVARERNVDWSYNERVCTVGDAHARRSFLQNFFRIELKSQIALDLLTDETQKLYYIHEDVRSMYLLLDGGGYFGGDRKFRVSLYERCEKNGVNLLAISKNSPSLHDEKGRDFIATAYIMPLYDLWVYRPFRKADKDKSLYEDITVVKLCGESLHVFRCGVMDYLTDREIGELLSPLTRIFRRPNVCWISRDSLASS